jgi:hypothetical protein
MESSNWSDDDKREAPAKSDKNEPSNFVYGPDRFAVYGEKPWYDQTEGEIQIRPVFTPEPERSEPETVRAITIPEVSLPEPAQVEQPYTTPAAQEAENSYYAEATKEDDDEDEEDDDDDAPAKPPVPVQPEEFGPVAPMPVIFERPRAEAPVVEAAEVPQPTLVKAAEPTPEPTLVPPRAETPLPFKPLQAVEAPVVERQHEEPLAPLTAYGNQPPKPPQPPEIFDQVPEYPEPEPTPAVHASRQSAFQPASQFSPNFQPNRGDYVTRDEFYRAQHDTRRDIAGATITSLLIGQYLDHRRAKKLREKFDKQAYLQGQKMNTLQGQQEAAGYRTTYQNEELRRTIESQQHAPTQPETPIRPPLPQAERPAGQPQSVPQEQLARINQVEQPWELQPEEQVKRSAWHSYVERDGHVVEDAIDYGEAYQQERLRERIPTPFGTQDARFKTGGFYQGQVGAPMPVGSPQQPMLSSGQQPQDHMISPSQPMRDEQHLLTPPEPNPLIATLTNPWLWLAVGVLMIAFFAAASI